MSHGKDFFNLLCSILFYSVLLQYDIHQSVTRTDLIEPLFKHYKHLVAIIH